MGYDNSKDELIKSFTTNSEDSKPNEIIANIHSYNGGDKKLALSRTYERNGEMQNNGRIGRMTLDEVKWLQENLNQMIELMED